jgi:hypothetical protein
MSGVYRDVRVSDETGDADGFEVEIDAAHPHPTVVFTICEGGCYGGDTWPITIEGSHISFNVTHKWSYGDGSPAPSTSAIYEGTVDDQVLHLRSPEMPDLDARLTRVANPTPGQTARLAKAN